MDIFTDGFESGDLTQWTGSAGDIQVLNAAANIGSFGAQAQPTEAFAYKDFSAPASTIVSILAKFRITSALSGSGRLRILQLSEGGTYVALFYYDNGAYKLEIRNEDGSLSNVTLSTSFTLNTWYTIELIYDWTDSNNAVAKVYVDDTLINSIIESGTPGTQRTITRAFILAFVDSGSVSGTVNFDSVNVADGVQSSGSTQYNVSVDITITPIVSVNKDANKIINIASSVSQSLIKFTNKTIIIGSNITLQTTKKLFVVINTTVSATLDIAWESVTNIIKSMIKDIRSITLRGNNTDSTTLKGNDDADI